MRISSLGPLSVFKPFKPRRDSLRGYVPVAVRLAIPSQVPESRS